MDVGQFVGAFDGFGGMFQGLFPPECWAIFL